jgi:tetratricopeptide (TPR) repeat protein
MYREQDVHSPKLSEEIEERLRPNRFLGYDRDHLGIALLRREMFDAAESQFRRAMYLNPFEASFRQHLAWCLYRKNKYEEALTVIEEAIRLNPKDPDANIVRDRIREKLSVPQDHTRGISLPNESA